MPHLLDFRQNENFSQEKASPIFCVFFLNFKLLQKNQKKQEANPVKKLLNSDGLTDRRSPKKSKGN